MLGLLIGCGGSKEPASTTATKTPAAKAPPAAMPALAPAQSSPAPGTAAKPGDTPAPPVFDFAAAGRPLDNSGKALSDLDMLNQAILSYGIRRMPQAGADPSKAKSVNEAAALMAAQSAGPPPLKSLSDLVKAGVIKSLPVAPPGKEYALDPNTRMAVLVDKK